MGSHPYASSANVRGTMRGPDIVSIMQLENMG
jgi:hypothetical protein